MLCFILHARLRVHLASGIPCALFYRAYEKFLQKLGRAARRDRGGAPLRCCLKIELRTGIFVGWVER
jgi:hypothetical protein